MIAGEMIIWNIYSCRVNQSLKEGVSVVKSFPVVKTQNMAN